MHLKHTTSLLNQINTFNDHTFQSSSTNFSKLVSMGTVGIEQNFCLWPRWSWYSDQSVTEPSKPLRVFLEEAEDPKTLEISVEQSFKTME